LPKQIKVIGYLQTAVNTYKGGREKGRGGEGNYPIESSN
jgi:hypothetical protein